LRKTALGGERAWLLRQVDAVFALKAVVLPNLASLQSGRFALWYQPI
jgi:hypothetical protein